MLIELRLTASKFISHNEVITLPEEKVEIQFCTTAHSMGELILTVESPATEGGERYKIGKMPINLTKHFTLPGEVKMWVSLCVRGETSRTWIIEPFCVKEIEGEYIAVPEIVVLKERITTLERAVSELVTIIQN